MRLKLQKSKSSREAELLSCGLVDLLEALRSAQRIGADRHMTLEQLITVTESKRCGCADRADRGIAGLC
jgi:hypothetical protein